MVYIRETNRFRVQKFDSSTRFEDDMAARKWLAYNKAEKSYRVRAWILSRIKE